MTSNNHSCLLSGNQLKIFAAITMTVDHIGAYLLPHLIILRIIGRLAFPIFAYMIAEGCTYTKNRKKYLLTILAFGAVFQLVYFLVMGSLSQCIFVTFSMSIALIFALDKAKNDLKYAPLALGAAVLVLFITEVLPRLLSGTDFHIDYGLFGTLLPVFVYFGRGKWQKLLLLTIGLVLVSGTSSFLQWFCLFSVPVLALYGGKRGRFKMKNFFYIYYPAHLVVIYLIAFIIK